MHKSGNISVHVIAGDEVPGEPIPKKTIRTAEHQEAFDLLPYIAALAFVAAALGVSEAMWQWIGVENVGLVFLTAIVAVAVRFGLWPSLGQYRLLTLLLFLFFATDLHVHDCRPDECDRFCVFHSYGDHRLQCCIPRALSCPRRHGSRPSADSRLPGRNRH